MRVHLLRIGLKIQEDGNVCGRGLEQAMTSKMVAGIKKRSGESETTVQTRGYLWSINSNPALMDKSRYQCSINHLSSSPHVPHSEDALTQTLNPSFVLLLAKTCSTTKP